MAVSRLPILAAFSVVLLAALASPAMSRDLPDDPMYVRFVQWTAQYGRTYISDVEEEARFNVFKNNVEFIESFNKAENRSYKLGINSFADLTNEEFAARNKYKSSTKQRNATLFSYADVNDVPDSVDWRSKGAVTPVKNQGRCGSCWAFSTVGALEGLHQIRTGNLVDLSEQELVDCDTDGDVDNGCRGGMMENAFSFIRRNGGLSSEDSYPYQAAEGTCQVRNEPNPAATLAGSETVPFNDEVALRKAVSYQPVSVSIEGSGEAFRFYSGGIFTGACGTSLDHAVVAVGYGTSSFGTKYWLLKNSWGEEWGEGGFMRMERDIDDKEGLCGIAMEPIYPIA